MISHSSHPPASTLRERMIEDMSVRGFGEKTRNDYIRNVRAFGPHVTTLPSPVLNDTATGQIPIVDAPPAPPARGFLPRRLSDAGPPTSAPSADHARPASETLVWTSGNRGSRRKPSIVPRAGRCCPAACTIGGFNAALCRAGRVAEDDGDLYFGRARSAALARRMCHRSWGDRGTHLQACRCC